MLCIFIIIYIRIHKFVPVTSFVQPSINTDVLFTASQLWPFVYIVWPLYCPQLRFSFFSVHFLPPLPPIFVSLLTFLTVSPQLFPLLSPTGVDNLTRTACNPSSLSCVSPINRPLSILHKSHQFLSSLSQQTFGYEEIVQPVSLMGTDLRAPAGTSPNSQSRPSRPWHDFARHTDGDKIQIPKMWVPDPSMSQKCVQPPPEIRLELTCMIMIPDDVLMRLNVTLRLLTDLNVDCGLYSVSLSDQLAHNHHARWTWANLWWQLYSG